MGMPMEEAMMEAVVTWKKSLMIVEKVVVEVELLLNFDKQAAGGLLCLVVFVAPWMEVGGRVGGEK